MNILRMILVGLLLIVLVTVAEFLVTIPLGSPPEEANAEWLRMVDLELLLTALPAGLLTFLAAVLLKLPTRRDSLLHAAVWTGLYALSLLLVLRGNGILGIVLVRLPVYVLLAFHFLGPLVQARIRHLPQAQPPGSTTGP